MEKREIGYFSYEFSIDKENWYEDRCTYGYHYLLNPKDEEIIATDYNGIDKYAISYNDRDGFLGLFGNPIKVILSWDDYKLIIHEQDFVYIKKQWHKADLSIEELSRKLSADDFIQYMRDKGMNVCPMNIK